MLTNLDSVSRPSRWGMTPRQSVERECADRGKDEVVAACVALLDGSEVDADLIVALGGPPAARTVTGGPPVPSYWLRVWALRGLLWAWDDQALPAVACALSDEEWRVREMALKVAARYRLEDTLATVADRQEDPVPRVRAAACRALIRLTNP